MAHRAIGEMVVVDIRVREYCRTLRIRGKLPVRIKNVRGGPQALPRIAVAVETPFHGQRCRLPDQRHGGDIAVTCGATDTFGDMIE